MIAGLLAVAALADNGFDASVVVDTVAAEKVRAADLDGDGDVDLVTALSFSPTGLRIFLNAGDGVTFEAVTIDAVTTTYDVLPADFDGDGDVDLLVDSIRGVQVFERVGPTAFCPGPLIAGYVTGLVAADLDGDGDPDAAWIDGNTVRWAANLGDQSWSAPVVVDTIFGADAEALTVGDLDGDGDLDLVGEASTGLGWYENLGGGTFTPSAAISSVLWLSAVDLGDLDGDGDLDLVSTDWNINTVAWHENLGGGVFGGAVTLSIVADNTQGAKIADLDGDGDLDVVATSRDAGRVEWSENTGGGVFTLPQLADEVPFALGPVVADLDGDGALDVVVAGADLEVVFRTAEDLDLDGLADDREAGLGADPALTDTDGDGVDDGDEHLAGTSPSDGTDLDTDADGLADRDELLLGTDPLLADSDQGGVDDASELTAGTDPLLDTDDDLDRDGLSDLMETTSLPDRDDSDCDGLDDPVEFDVGTEVLIADTDDDGALDGAELAAATDPFLPDTDGGGALDGAELELGTDPFDPLDDWAEHVIDDTIWSVDDELFVTDFDGDGDPDVVGGMRYLDCQVYFGRDGELAAGVVIEGTSDLHVVGDVDGDGDADLVHGAGEPWLYRANLGSGVFQADVEIGDEDPYPEGEWIADLDGDSDGDLLVASRDEGLWWWPMVGDDRFGPKEVLSTFFVNSAVIADFEGDGDPDVAAFNATTDTIDWWEQDGGFRPSALVAAVSPDTTWIDAGDFDGDGDLDLLTWEYLLPHTRWIENLGGGGFAAPVVLALGDEGPRAIGDIDLDGRDDLVMLVGTEIQLHTDVVGAPTEILVLPTVLADPRAVRLADIDRDGDRDVVVGADEPGLLWLENSFHSDSDDDGLVDPAEALLGTDPAVADTDGDGVTDRDEWIDTTDPLDALDLDTDHDGSSDAAEVAAGTSPTDPRDPWDDDRDGDGLTDLEEEALGTDPALSDSDQDLLDDGEESALATSPLDADTDDDGLLDGVEVEEHGTDPTAADSDHGGASDPVEIADGKDPWDRGDDWVETRVDDLARGVDDITAADVDRDGQPDLLWNAVRDGQVRVAHGATGFVITVANEETWGEPQAVVAGDLDRDGWPDLVVSYWTGDAVRLFLGPEPFGAGIDLPLDDAHLPGRLALGDVDQDGRTDVVIGYANSVRWSENVGGAGFALPVVVDTTDRVTALALLDTDGDTFPELVVGDDGALQIGSYPNLAGTFGGEQVLHGGWRNGSCLVPLDLEGDGDQDLVFGDSYGIGVLEETGAGFAAQVHLTENSAVAACAGADLDLDGDLDVVASSALHGLAWYPNQGDGDLGAANVLTTGFTGPPELVVADLDTDGDPDVAAAFDGRVAWFRNGLHAADADQDGLVDQAEPALGFDPTLFDTDGDGIGDRQAYQASLVPPVPEPLETGDTGGPEPTTPAETGDTGGTPPVETGDTGPTEPAADEDPSIPVDDPVGGCGCGTGPGSVGWLLLPVVGLLVRRRSVAAS